MITEERAVAIARKECERQGQVFAEPVIITQDLKRKVWEIVTNKKAKGGNAHIRIDQDTGHVVSTSFSRS